MWNTGVLYDVPTLREQEPALLTAIASGDRAAFAVLYARYHPLVDRWVRHQLVDPWQSEEVVQDVFLEVWRIADRYDPERPVVGWIRTIAQRRAIDRVRTVQADRDRERRLAARHLDVVGPGGIDGAETVLDRRALHRAVAGLPEHQRRAVVLRHLDELSGPELAERLGVPLGTAKTRARDGVLRLRRVLGA